VGQRVQYLGRSAAYIAAIAVLFHGLSFGAATTTTKEIVAQVLKATVSIRTKLPGGAIVAGTGFIVDPSGIVVTNYHVVKGAERIEVRLATGETYDVSGIRAVDRHRDIAVIQFPGFKEPTVTLGDSDTIGPGESIIVIGNALGMLENSVTSGVVSAIRDIDGEKLIQMDAPISPGNSGGPVVNSHGEVVAITVARLKAGVNLNFSIPINFARGFVSQPVQPGLAAVKETEQDLSLFADPADSGSKGSTKRWISLTSGTVRTVTVSDDIVLSKVILTPQAEQQGAKTWLELKKQGDKWVGTGHVHFPCTYMAPFKGLVQKVCQIDSPAEITSMTATKIEGNTTTYPSNTEFQCRSCAADKPMERKSFTWIPTDN
jgi:S1-C subfamily serine protease